VYDERAVTDDNETGFPGSLLEAIGDAVVVVSRDGDIVFVNRRAEILLGYARDELIGRQVEVLVPDGLRDGHARFCAEYVAAPEPRPMGSGRELTAVRRDGSELAVEISLGVATVDGEPCVVCGLHDVTELRAREDRLQQLVDSMPGLFYIFDTDGRLVWWNRKFEEVLGYASDELAGMHVLDFLHPDDREVVATRMAALFEDGVSRTAEYRLLLKDGSLIPYAGTGALCDIAGRPHMVGLTLDVSELHDTRLELENTYLRSEIQLAHHHGDIVGESDALRAVLSQVERVAVGRGSYTVTTEEPPVDAFWSLTVYDTERGGYFHPNACDRYHINNTTAARNDDGTVTFTFKTSCGEADLNCLEVPAGRFDITARYYMPRDPIINGSWKLPGITLVEAQ